MAEPDNMILVLLRELRQSQDRLEQKIDAGFDETRKSMESMRRALHGESVLGRYAASEVDEQIQDIHRRPAALESRS